MQSLEGVVFDIQKFSIHDGPGIRTTVFLKGCPLRCVWCHNPESHSAGPELFFHADKCLACGGCVTACPQYAHVITPDGGHKLERQLCCVCGRCAAVCPASALEICGKKLNVGEVMDKVRSDFPFYRDSGGGMTLSGGEPMMQFAFSRALLRSAKEGENIIHTAMETCGFAPVEHYRDLLELVDLFLFDIKSLLPEKHLRFTGVALAPILETLRFLDGAGAKISLRCPLIPGLNDSEEELRLIAALADSLRNVCAVELEPYHPLGVGKAAKLGKVAAYAAPFAARDYPEKIAAFLQPLTAVSVRKA